MPSKDTYHEKHPETNAWMKDEDGNRVSSDRVRRHAIGRSMSGQVMRLARRLRLDPDALAERIPADTLRRTKFPVIEQVTEDGKRIFKDDPGIIEGPRSLFHK